MHPSKTLIRSLQLFGYGLLPIGDGTWLNPQIKEKDKFVVVYFPWIDFWVLEFYVVDTRFEKEFFYYVRKMHLPNLLIRGMYSMTPLLFIMHQVIHTSDASAMGTLFFFIFTMLGIRVSYEIFRYRFKRAIKSQGIEVKTTDDCSLGSVIIWRIIVFNFFVAWGKDIIAYGASFLFTEREMNSFEVSTDVVTDSLTEYINQSLRQPIIALGASLFSSFLGFGSLIIISGIFLKIADVIIKSDILSNMIWIPLWILGSALGSYWYLFRYRPLKTKIT